MKKNLSLILALVMLLGSIFGVMSMAEATEGATPPADTAPATEYVPEIKYSNVNYTDKLYMMFAVPAPTSLAEGSDVKLILWEGRDLTSGFSYNDQRKLVINADAETVKIGEADYLVFKYDALTAADMSKAVYARPAVISGEKATVYGSVVEYSVLEYISAAKGEFESIAGIEDQDHLKVLDSMLEFGALAERYLLEEEPEFYANEKLNKVYVTPVVGSKVGDAVFAGFFKYTEDGCTTLSFPHFDGYEAVSVSDKNGAAIVDADEDEDGFQLATTEGDIEITVNYAAPRVAGALDAADYSNELDVNAVLGKDSVLGDGCTYSKCSQIKLKNGCIFNMSATYNPLSTESESDLKKYPYHGLKSVADPDDENGRVLQWTATSLSQVSLPGIKPANLPSGFGDTIAPVLTLTVRLGRVNGGALSIDIFRLRHDSAQGKVYVPIFDTSASGNVYAGASSDANFVATLPESGMQTFAFAIDFRAETIKAYAENLETGEMEFKNEVALVRPDNFKKSAEAGISGYESFESWITTLTVTAQMLCSSGNWTKAHQSASVELDGVMTPIKNADGTYNPLAIQKYCEANSAMLIDDLGFFAGDIYAK